MSKKKERAIEEMYTEILNSTVDEVHKKGVLNLLAREMKPNKLAEVVVERFNTTKDQFYLGKLTEITMGVLNASIFDEEECSQYDCLAEKIQEVCESNRECEGLAVWFDQLCTVVLEYAPVCNCNEFIKKILNVARGCKLPVVSWKLNLLNAYKSTNKVALFVESVAYYETAVEGKCICKYIDLVWDDEEDGHVPVIKYDPQRCDSKRCNVVSCIMAFTTAICRHKVWMDTFGWKAVMSYKGMYEVYKEYNRAVEDAYQLLASLECHLPQMELFTKQWELFSGKYVHRKNLRNFDWDLETRTVPAIAMESEI